LRAAASLARGDAVIGAVACHGGIRRECSCAPLIALVVSSRSV
jgi:hypothetical protein